MQQHRDDIFQISLSLGKKVVPGVAVRVELVYSSELEWDAAAAAVRFDLPLVLSPRHEPVLPSPVDSKLLPCAGQQMGSFEWAVSADIRMRDSIQTISCPSYAARVMLNGNVANVEVSKGDFDRNASPSAIGDLVLLVKPRKALNFAKAFLEERAFIGIDDSKPNPYPKALMVSLLPSLVFQNPVDLRHDFIFLLDCSGSMGGSMQHVIQSMQIFLRSLPTTACFNIIKFGSTFEQLFPRSMPYDKRRLDAASVFVENLRANLGGTELLSPLQSIFQTPFPEALLHSGEKVMPFTLMGNLNRAIFFDRLLSLSYNMPPHF